MKDEIRFYPSQHKFGEKNSKIIKDYKDGQMPPFKQTPKKPPPPTDPGFKKKYV